MHHNRLTALPVYPPSKPTAEQIELAHSYFGCYEQLIDSWFLHRDVVPEEWVLAANGAAVILYDAKISVVDWGAVLQGEVN